MRVLAAILVLAALGCAKKGASSGPPAQTIGVLIALPGTHTVGPPPRPTSWPGIRATKISPDVVAPIGSSAVLEVEVRDDLGAPVAGAQVRFTSQKIGAVHGLGTSSTDFAGRAAVTAIPAQLGTTNVRAEATTAHAIAAPVTFTVTGR